MRMGEWSETEHLDRYLDADRPGAGRARALDDSPAAHSRPAQAEHALAVTVHGRIAAASDSSLGRRLFAPRWPTQVEHPAICPIARLIQTWHSAYGRHAGDRRAASGGRALALAAGLLCAAGRRSAALIVDGESAQRRPRKPGRAPAVGNDVTFLFLPHHLSIGKVIAEFGHLPVWDARGFGGRPLVGNPQAGMFYPPVWLVWWAASGGPRLADGRAPALGRARRVRARAVVPRGAMGGDGRGRRLPGVAISPGPHVRGPLSARLGGLLVSLGVLGLWPGAVRAALRGLLSFPSPWP